jgi:hypothetical protein
MKIWIPMWVIIIAVLIFTPFGRMIISLLLKPVMLIGDFLGIFEKKTTPINSQSEENEEENDYSNSIRRHQPPQFKDEA